MMMKFDERRFGPTPKCVLPLSGTLEASVSGLLEASVVDEMGCAPVAGGSGPVRTLAAFWGLCDNDGVAAASIPASMTVTPIIQAAILERVRCMVGTFPGKRLGGNANLRSAR